MKLCASRNRFPRNVVPSEAIGPFYLFCFVGCGYELYSSQRFQFMTSPWTKLNIIHFFSAVQININTPKLPKKESPSKPPIITLIIADITVLTVSCCGNRTLSAWRRMQKEGGTSLQLLVLRGMLKLGFDIHVWAQQIY